MTDRELELIDGMIEVQLTHAERCDSIPNRAMAEKQKGWDMERVELLKKLRATLAQPESEPVAWFCKLPDNKISIKIVGKPTEGNWEPLYTAPQKKEWVGLTAYEIQELHSENPHWGNFACAINAKLKEKNK